MTSIEIRLQTLEEWIKRIARTLNAIRDKADNTQQQQQQAGRGSISGSAGMIKAYTTGTITARSGTTAGTGNIDLYYFPPSSSTITAQSISTTCRNIFGSSVASGSYIYVAWVDDGYELISADC